MEAYKVLNNCSRSIQKWNDEITFQEIFKKIYENHNEEVYLKDVVVFLRKAYENIDDNHDVKILLDQYDISGDRELTFNEFAVSLYLFSNSLLISTFQQIMDDLCSHGWKLEAAEESEDIDEVDMKELFIEADIARRNSVELLVTPAPKVNNSSLFQNTCCCVLLAQIIGYSSINLIDSSDPLKTL